MKIKLATIVDGIEFQTDETKSFLNLSTAEVDIFTDDEIDTASSGDDISEHADWYKVAIARAKEYLENEENYLPLPSQFEVNEYRIMEEFISELPIEEQREALFKSIKGKGAFSRFRRGLERFLLIDKWYKYKEEALIDFAEQWCKEKNIDYKK